MTLVILSPCLEPESLPSIAQLSGWWCGAGVLAVAKLCPGSSFLRSTVRKTNRSCNNIGKLKTQVCTPFCAAPPEVQKFKLCSAKVLSASGIKWIDLQFVQFPQFQEWEVT